MISFRLTPAKIGINATEEVGKVAKKFGLGKVLIVTGRNVGSSEICKRVKESLESANIEYEVWSNVKPEPDVECVKEGIEVAKDFDGFIGLGGGSAIDIAKLLNLYTTHPPQDFFDYIPKPFGKGIVVDKPLKPLIAIPTTAGTGSETTCASVVKLSGIKVGIVQECLLPSFAIIDPLNITPPPNVVASSGLDALMHAVEAYTVLPAEVYPYDSPYSGSNPITDSLALKAIELIAKNLRRAYHWRDLNSITNMAIASYIAGVAFGNAGVHLGHALGHAIGGARDIPHGICVAIVGDAILDYIKPVMPEKVEGIRAMLGSIKSLMEDLNVPTSLSDLGFDRSDLPKLAENAMKLKRLIDLCPRRADVEGLITILEKSF